MKKIGFIGLGNMGKPMACNLAKFNYGVVGYDINEAIYENIKCKTTNNIIEAVKEKDIVITMLPEGAHVLEVIEKIYPHMEKGSLHIDCSTIDVETAKQIHQRAKTFDIKSLDSPVSGGIMGAVNGTLAFMIGGEKKCYESNIKVFEKMGAKIIYCGGAGSGQVAKMCNNMVLAVTMIGTCESFALAKKLGLEHQALFDVLSVSSGQSWSTTTYCPVAGPVETSPANKNYEAGFMVDLMKKDLQLSQAAASSVSASTPLGKMALELYSAFSKKGFGGLDFSAIIKEFEKN